MGNSAATCRILKEILMSASQPSTSDILFRSTRLATFCSRCLVAALVLMGAGGAARAATPPTPAEVLAKLHQSNGHEIAMGKLAQQKGQSKDVKAFGRTLVKDHSAADKKVLAFAKAQKIDLPTVTDHKGDMDTGGPDFDAKFAQAMLDDHKKDVAEVMSARDTTTDDKLKTLLNELLPALEKHRDTAQKLVDGSKK
jgi:predicted outer membrane protein